MAKSLDGVLVKISKALRGKKKPARTEEYKQAQSKRIKEWWAARKKA